MRNAIVIGGTRGIGAGVVETLIADGWSVTATGVSSEEVAEFREAMPEIPASLLDVTDQDAVEAFFDPFTTLNGLVNCAGINRHEKEYSLEIFQQVIDVNLTGTMRTCLSAHSALKAAGGSIVNTASMLSFFGGPLSPAYSASKGGVSQLTRALAGRWADDGVRVNAVAPGWIETAMTHKARTDPVRSKAILHRTPMGRWGAPTEVGALVAWLLSDRAEFVTGAIYPVDGGYSAM